MLGAAPPPPAGFSPGHFCDIGAVAQMTSRVAAISLPGRLSPSDEFSSGAGTRSGVPRCAGCQFRPAQEATRAMVTPSPSNELNDDALADDIDLLAEVVVAATGVECALTQDEVDRALGLAPRGTLP